jgi:hypothetical protein
MKHQIELGDTLIIMQHEKIQICKSKGHCQNHPNQFIWVHRTTNADSLVEMEQKTDVEQPTIRIPVQKITETHELTAFDTIKPCDSKWLESGDSRLTSEFIEFPAQTIENKPKFPGDAIGFGLVCGFVSYMAINYVFDCVKNGYWSEFFTELKTEWNS